MIGYIRNAQKLIQSYPIPMDISYLCLLYFYEYDYFFKCGDSMDINETGDTVNVIFDGEATCYGKIDISNRNESIIYEWKFKILRFDHQFAEWIMCIGIDASNREHCNDFFCKNFHKEFQYCKALENDGTIRSNGEYFVMDQECPYFEGDTITMVLDPKQEKLKYFKNDEDECIVIVNVEFEQDTKYNMAVFAGDEGVSIQLIEFNKRIKQP